MILALVKPLSVAHCLRKPVKCTFLHTLTIHPSDVYLACVAGGICERASSGRAAIFPRGLCTRRNSWAAKPLVKFNSTQLDSTRLFTNLLTASLPKQKHSPAKSRQRRRLIYTFVFCPLRLKHFLLTDISDNIIIKCDVSAMSSSNFAFLSRSV